MARTAPDHFIIEYEKGVTQVFQAQGSMLQACCRKKPLKGAPFVRFRFLGTIGTQTKPMENTALVPLQPQRTFVDVTPQRNYAPVAIEDQDLDRLDYDDKEALQTAGAMALGRRYDQMLVEALNAGTAPTTVGDGTAGMGLAMLMRARLVLGNQTQEAMGTKWGLIDRLSYTRLMSYKEFASADYVGPHFPMMDGLPERPKTYQGVNWLCCPDDYFPVPAANQRDLFVFNQNAVGGVEINDIKAQWSWENRLDQWFCNQNFDGGFAKLQNPGVIRIRTKSDAPIQVERLTTVEAA